MGGVGLGRLWDSHPKWAFALHLAVTLMLGGFAVSALIAGGGWSAVIVVAGFAVMAASLAVFTWSAIQRDWRPDQSETWDSPSTPSPSVAWESAQTAERVLWVLFAVVFLTGMALLLARSVVGFVLVVLSLALAIVAMRAHR